jgi:uncharacterized paraquat-inducible protein A
MSPIGRKTFQPALALSLAGLFALLLANTNPVLTFDVAGREQHGYIVTGIGELFRQGYWPIAILVCVASMLAPALYLSSVAYVSAPCSIKLRLPRIHQAMHLSE